ncbi:MAG TPA: 16S rRNA (uracil(1498)-N(3))-methyltransferase [Verrucomicrobiae bacterium]|nr:16S rRNA (uracil(1498)-N(3))-methyltransferase [Verrucomicrobiae bacterium]
MPARRFFVRDAHHAGEVVAIHGSDAHKIVNVLRLRNGDLIEVVDSRGAVFAATLESKDGALHARLTEARGAPPERAVVIDVAQGIPKGQKMDFVVEKLGELGVRALLPLRSERTIVTDVGPAKLERWRRLARSAAQQSGRADLLTVTEPLPFAQLRLQFSEYDAVIMPWEIAEPEPLRKMLPEIVRGARTVLVVIGPEGGFSHAEAESAQAAGARLVSLGSRILRTETAALAVVAILAYELGI